MIKSVDSRLSREVLFLLWAMEHGDEVAVVDTHYLLDEGRELEGHVAVVRMNDVDTPQAVRAILSALQLDTTFVAHPVRHVEYGHPDPIPDVRREVQDEVDDALGFSCSILGVARPDFHEQVKECRGVVIAGGGRDRGALILRKGLDVTPDTVLAAR